MTICFEHIRRQLRQVDSFALGYLPVRHSMGKKLELIGGKTIVATTKQLPCDLFPLGEHA